MGDAEFESLLRRAWETGRRQWPQVDLPAEAFIRHVASLLSESRAQGALAPLSDKLDLGDLYLACACVNDVPGAGELFEQRYIAKLPALLGYLKLSSATLDEICQQVRTHLLVRTPERPPRLAEYTGRGALMVWMRVIAVRMTLRQGSAARELPDEHGIVVLEDLPDPGMDAEMALLKSHYRHEFRRAVREAFASLSDEQRYLLRLHFIEGIPTTRMGPLFGKDQSTISRWLKDVREQVYEETKRRLKERLRLTSQEFESLMSTIQSRFDVSLSQILGDEAGGEEKSQQS
jgi:RNA polymerase sigma-70 factor (ECF subfamily)